LLLNFEFLDQASKSNKKTEINLSFFLSFLPLSFNLFVFLKNFNCIIFFRKQQISVFFLFLIFSFK